MAPENVDHIRRRMAEIRLVLANDASHLAVSAKKQTDWKYYVTRHPWVCATAAAAVGFLLVPSGARRTVVDAATLVNLSRRGNVEVQQRKQKSLLAGTILPLVIRLATSQGMAFVQQLAKQQFAAKSKPAAEQPQQQSFSFRSRG